MLTEVFLAVTKVIFGALGTGIGVTLLEAVEAILVPIAFFAVTVKVYAV
jgi:hypothetical protein